MAGVAWTGSEVNCNKGWSKVGERMKWYFLLVSGICVAACNPFVEAVSGEGEPCKEAADCATRLVCHSGYCEKPKEVDCSKADCSAPGTEGQGEDKDLDNWGACCDCDDEHAEVNPGEKEKAYNGIDDDCSGKTSDGDFDLDGYDAIEYGGDDCDDSDFDIHPGAEEICNGMDDDCDAETDEDFEIGEACTGMGQCGDGVWECASESATRCSTMPGGSQDQSSEEICDRLDNDCDGETDEDAIVLEPESGAEADDGIDNNCNGLVDEKGGVMVPVNGIDGVWIDAYEMTVFDSPDCDGTGIRYGENSNDYPDGFPADGTTPTVTLYACSLPGIIPSGYMSRSRVQFACLAQGKRLCSGIEFKNACQFGDAVFPYDSYIIVPGVCNDPIGGAGHVVPTGTYADCSADGSTFDMSGNLAEWVSDVHDDHENHPDVGYVAGWSYSAEICDNFGKQCDPYDPDSEDSMDSLKEALSCPVSNYNSEEFPFDKVRRDFGGRCCMDGPD